MLKLGEIDISSRNYLSLSKELLVPLVVLHGAKQGGVKPRFLVSLRLKRLRWLNWVLALCPRGSRLSPRSHEKEQNNGERAGREINEHN